MAISTPTTPGQILTSAYVNDNINSGLTYINQFTLSGGTTNLTSIFSSSYDDYLLVVSGATSTAGVIDKFQMLNATTPATTANYNSVRWTASNPSTFAQVLNATSGQLITTFTSPSSYVINIYSPFSAAKTQLTATGVYNGSTDLSFTESNSATHTLSTSYDGISFIATGTTWTAGKVTVYGYRK